jgi:epoxyqueuosine reductase QueG
MSTTTGKYLTMDLGAFFREEGNEEYVIVRLEDLPDADRSGPLHLIPCARSVITFGMEIPVPVYEAPPREKNQKMLRIAETLDRTALRLADYLSAENFRSAVVPLFLYCGGSLGGCRE